MMMQIPSTERIQKRNNDGPKQSRGAGWTGMEAQTTTEEHADCGRVREDGGRGSMEIHILQT
jgi:hypothetical protein